MEDLHSEKFANKHSEDVVMLFQQFDRAADSLNLSDKLKIGYLLSYLSDALKKFFERME